MENFQKIFDLIWPLILNESGTSIMWTLIGGIAGLLLSILLIIVLWMALKKRNFLGGETGPSWPRNLLLVSWILLIPISSATSGGIWGLVTAAYKIVEKQKLIEETVSVATEKPIIEILNNLTESPELSSRTPPLLLNVSGDQTTLSITKLRSIITLYEDFMYELIKKTLGLSFLNADENQTLRLPKNIERWIIDSILAENNPAIFAKKLQLVLNHVEKNAGSQVTVRELGHSLGSELVKPHIDKIVKDIKISIIMAAFIQIIIILALSVAITSLLVYIVRAYKEKNSGVSFDNSPNL